MHKKLVFICEFPPPYGGVTVKNKLTHDLLTSMGYSVECINLMRCKENKAAVFGVIVRILRAYLTKEPIIYGMGSYQRLAILLRLQRILGGRNSLSKTTNIVMGGTYSSYLNNHAGLRRINTFLRSNWVEANAMIDQLRTDGIENGELFPNPKSEAGACPPVPSDPGQPLRLVFFSQISKEKGVDDIIQLVELLKERDISYHIDFFGHVVPEIQERFHAFVAQNANVDYCGVFDSAKSSVYEKLNGYDILLFPTRWANEGVPGILVEAKMAGLAVIASDRNFNAEIIQEDRDEGFIIREDYPREMAELVNRCAEDRALVNRMKEGSFHSRKRYALEEYESMAYEI